MDWDGADAPAFAGGLRALAPAHGEVRAEVERIVEGVRSGGDAGLREVAERLGEAVPESFRVDPEAVAAAPGLLEPEVREAMRVAGRNIQAVARAELEARARPATAELPEGQRVEVREEPVATAGVYAPGGKAAYPSSVLMCCVPARVAGVARLCVASPPGAGRAAQRRGAGGVRDRGRGRGLRDRRGAGDRGAGVRHRDDRAGRPDRRAREPLRDRGQAAGLGDRSGSTASPARPS